jgi:hypothetical protein
MGCVELDLSVVVAESCQSIYRRLYPVSSSLVQLDIQKEPREPVLDGHGQTFHHGRKACLTDFT